MPVSSPRERERLILEHLPQVRMIARRIHDRLPGNVSLDDLVSTGILGLISAIDRFDPSRNVQLRTYAEHKIKGAILDSLRRLDWAPRQQRKHAKQIDAAIAVTRAAPAALADGRRGRHRAQPHRRRLSPVAGEGPRPESRKAGVGGIGRFR